VYYSGQLFDTGEVFDSNYGAGTPFAVSLGPTTNVIEGWNEGLIGARPGDRIQLDIPSDLAYGDEGSQTGAIPGGAALTFVVDVVDVIHVDYPAERPTELVRRVVQVGPADGRAAQWFDTVSLYFILALPDIAATLPSTDAAESEPAEGSAPEASVDHTQPSSTDPASTADTVATTDPAVTTEPPAGEPGASSVASSEPTGPAASEPSATSEPDHGGAPGGTVLTQNFTADPSTGAVTPLDVNLIRGATGIAGLEEGLQGARPGDRIQLDIPASLAFGEAGSPDGAIPPDAPLTMFVEVVDVTGPPVVEVPDEVPTELQVTTLEDGTGPEAREGDTVFVNYVGVITETNERIASNWGGTPRPVELGAGTEIAGWEQGLVGAQAGDELQLDIPADLAYGSEGVPDDSVPADVALSFIVQVVAVVPTTTDEDAPTDLELPLSSTPLDETATSEAPAGTGGESSELPAGPEPVIADVVAGTGEEAAPGSTAVVNLYAVCATNGAVLQNTWGDEQREYITLTTGSVIPGLVDGIVGMQVGGRRIIQVPASLAFEDTGSTELGVGPDRDLIFVVELYGVLNAAGL
jgi:peptidylprolyl isomerase